MGPKYYLFAFTFVVAYFVRLEDIKFCKLHL